MIGDDLHRRPGAFGDVAQNRRDPRSGAVRRHLHGEHLHGVMIRAVTGLDQAAGGDAQDHQTLRGPKSQRMIGDENPILASFRRRLEDRQPAAVDPVEHRSMSRHAHRQPRRQQAQHVRHPTAAEPGLQVHPQRQLHDQQRMMMTGWRHTDETLDGFRRFTFALGRRVVPCRQCPVFPIRTTRFQIADLDLGRAQTPLLIQGFGFPRIARFQEQAGQSGDGGFKGVHR
ncbi:hypothetical protein CKO23_24745 [Thiocystis violacea]|nr:hypothetical protein [Thiocystis violacea]